MTALIYHASGLSYRIFIVWLEFGRGLFYWVCMDDDQIIGPASAGALQADVARTHPLFGWAIWRDPPDYWGKVIARLVIEQPTPYILVADSLTELRTMLPAGLERNERRPCDAPELVEVWLGPDHVTN